jgi:hypothetical protein
MRLDPQLVRSSEITALRATFYEGERRLHQKFDAAKAELRAAEAELRRLAIAPLCRHLRTRPQSAAAMNRKNSLSKRRNDNLSMIAPPVF